MLEDSLLIRGQGAHLCKALELTALINRENQDHMIVLRKCCVELLLFEPAGGCPLTEPSRDADVFVVATLDHEVLCRWL